MRLESATWMRSLAALTLMLAGISACDDDKKHQGGAETVEGALAKVAPKSLFEIEATEDVILFAGTTNLTKALGEIQMLVTQVVPEFPPNMLPQMIGPAIQSEWALKDASAVNLEKPLRFVVFDPKKYETPPIALLVGVTSQAAFTATLPDNKQPGTDGNAFSYVKVEGSKRPVFVNFLGDFAVLTRDRGAFATHKDFFQKLIDAEVGDAGAMVVAMKNVARIFGADMERGIAEVKQQTAAIAQQTPGGDAQQAIVNQLFDWVGRSVKEVDAIHGRMVFEADGLRSQLVFKPVAGSALEKTFRAMEGNGRTDLLAKLPPDAPFFAVMSADAARMAELTHVVLDAFFAPMLGNDPAKLAAYKETMKAYMESLSGDFAFAAHGPQGQGLALSALLGVKDASKARESSRKVASLYQEPTAAAYYKQMGVEMALKPDAYMVGDVPVDLLESKLTTMPAQAAPMAAMLSGFMTQHIAFSKDVGVIGYGPEGKTTIEGFLNGTIKGGLDQDKGVQRALKHKAENMWMLVYVSPVDLARELKLGGMNPFAAMLTGVEAQTGLAISTGGRDGAMHLVIDLPIETVQKGYQGFQQGKGAF